MADEHIRNPSPISPAAHPTSPVTTTPAGPTVNGEARGAPRPVGNRRSLGRTLLELVWPSTGAYVAQADSVREVVETVVFVVVLVLLLKSFAAEAFVIPTGSMAETLWGYQLVVTCPKCGFQFPVNCSSAVDLQEGEISKITGCICPNCRYHIAPLTATQQEDWHSGDRVLVAKSLFELGLMKPERREVVVFKYPAGPQKNHVPMNYIKRLIGLGGETIGIWYGKLYMMHDDQQDAKDRAANPLNLWKRDYMHEDKFAGLLAKGNDPQAFKKYLEDRIQDPQVGQEDRDRDRQTLEQYNRMMAEGRDGKFHILRKSPVKILALKRIVYDNDHPASDMTAFPRWTEQGSASWTADPNVNGLHITAPADGTAWLRYSNLVRSEDGSPPRPQLITDFMGYNFFDSVRAEPGGPSLPVHTMPGQNWVGDLILECEATVSQPTGDLVLELSKGVDRFRARWDLAAGTCTLIRVHDGKEETLDSKPSVLTTGTPHRLRLANVDDRLTVWVDSTLPFGDGVNYEPAKDHGPTAANDLQPASIGARGAVVSVRHLKLWRDTYYTLDAGPQASDSGLSGPAWADPSQWDSLRNLRAKTYFVQPGHYLCLGDNSPESSDGRSWGTVPERLMLGRALLVYYPFKANFWPLSSPVNRVGPIH
jgi:signal peptidase I